MNPHARPLLIVAIASTLFAVATFGALLHAAAPAHRTHDWRVK